MFRLLPTGALIVSLLLAALGCTAKSPRSPAADAPPEPTTFPSTIHFMVRYAGAESGICKFRVIRSAPDLKMQEVWFATGGPLDLPVGSMVECDLRSDRMMWVVDAPIIDYRGETAREIFATPASTPVASQP